MSFCQGSSNSAQGQGPDQLSLIEYCRHTPADIIAVGFINTFPSAGNGYVGVDHGNACWGEGSYYPGPGYNGIKNPAQDLLPSRCPRVQDSIPECQKIGKKILLSIGGAAPTWNPKTNKRDKTYKGQLKSAADGEYMANFLWKAYGPLDPTYTGVRPLDRGHNNATAGLKIDIDGFDFDIEDTLAGTDRLNGKYHLSSYTYPNRFIGETAGYVAMLNRLKTLAAAQTAKTGKKYIFSASPQCVLNPKEANLDVLIREAGFDMVFIQFYNQGRVSCTARARASGVVGAAFNYNAWIAYLNQANSKSKGARIYIGLLGGPTGSEGSPGDFLNVAEAQNLIKTYGRNAQIGGVMLWEATAAFKYAGKDLPAGLKYWHVIKNALLVSFY